MHEAMLNRKMEGEQATRYECTSSARGAEATLEINSQLIRDTGGEPTGIHSIARDVTERKDAEARQALLIHEVQHRAKNLLAVTQSIVRSTIRNTRISRTADETIAGRLLLSVARSEFMNVIPRRVELF